MGYSVSCGCGRAIEVRAADAGTDLRCGCGRTVLVPRLSQLRIAAGEKVSELSIFDTIHRLISEGQLPPEKRCVISGFPCDETHRIYIECERVWVKGGWTTTSTVLNVIALCIVPFWAWKLILMPRDPPETMGRERGLYVPVCVRSEFTPKLRRMSQSKLRAMLRSVEVYQKLLEQYPHATIHV